MWDNWVDAVVSTWIRHPRSDLRMDVRVGLNIERLIERHCRVNRVLEVVSRRHMYSWRVGATRGEHGMPDN